MDQKLKELWKNNKIMFFLLLIPILIVMFRNQLIDLLVANSRKVANDALKQDGPLAQQQAAAQAAAQAAVEHADSLDDDKKPVTPDWNEK